MNELPDGFILLAFDFPGKGKMEYVSNAQRADVIEAMREFIAKTESRGFATHIPEGLPMGDEEFNRLLNGPLSHPILIMSLNRLAIALSVVVDATGPTGAEALRAHCRARDENDVRNAGSG